MSSSSHQHRKSRGTLRRQHHNNGGHTISMASKLEMVKSGWALSRMMLWNKPQETWRLWLYFLGLCLMLRGITSGGQTGQIVALSALPAAWLTDNVKGRTWIIPSFHIPTPCQGICHLDIRSQTQPAREGRCAASSFAERRGKAAS